MQKFIILPVLAMTWITATTHARSNESHFARAGASHATRTLSGGSLPCGCLWESYCAESRTICKGYGPRHRACGCGPLLGSTCCQSSCRQRDYGRGAGCNTDCGAGCNTGCGAGGDTLDEYDDYYPDDYLPADDLPQNVLPQNSIPYNDLPTTQRPPRRLPVRQVSRLAPIITLPRRNGAKSAAAAGPRPNFTEKTRRSGSPIRTLGRWKQQVEKSSLAISPAGRDD